MMDLSIQSTQTIYLCVFAIPIGMALQYTTYSIAFFVGSITVIMKTLSISLFIINRELRHKYILFMALDLGEVINGIAFVTVGIGRADLFLSDTLYRTISVRRCLINKPWPIMLLIGAQLPAFITILISIERILAVLYPHLYSRLCGKYTKLMCIVMCTGTVAISILIAYLVSEQDREQWKTHHCPIISSVTKYYATFHFLFIFSAYSFSFSSLLILNLVQNRLNLSESIRKETRLTLYLCVTGFYLICLSIPAVIMLCIRWQIYEFDDFTSSLAYILPGVPAITTTIINFIFRKDYRMQLHTICLGKLRFTASSISHSQSRNVFNSNATTR